jgi:hypothetical protein
MNANAWTDAVAISLKNFNDVSRLLGGHARRIADEQASCSASAPPGRPLR